MDDGRSAAESLAIDIAGLLFEVRIAMAAVHFGIETLERRTQGRRSRWNWLVSRN
jgi:hypothetical protein